MAIEHHAASGEDGILGMRQLNPRRLFFLSALAATAIVGGNYFFSDKSADTTYFQPVVPGANHATRLALGGDAASQAVLVMLPGGARATPVAVRAGQDGVQVCQAKPLPVEAATTLQTPDEVFAVGCDAQSNISSTTAGKDNPVPLRGGITLHIVPTAQGESPAGSRIFEFRATVDK
ncbi:hypothetical protein IPL85_00620 [Candidatus Saccharibacteria bacterium]|nr:MAG: hypothetical protein IPL85_00620 [Candidatus Saccharibacteria bacterium]